MVVTECYGLLQSSGSLDELLGIVKPNVLPFDFWKGAQPEYTVNWM